MWQSYLNGILVAAGLIIAIGAQNAFVLAQSLRREHHLSVAALCVFCDAVLVSLGVFGLAKLLLENPTLLAIARWGGIAFLTWYGLKALLRALRPDALGNAAETGPRSRKAVLLAALAVTLLNPHVYLDTVLLIGSLGAQQAAPGADLAEAADQRVAQLQLVAQAPLEGRFVQARQQAPGRLHRHLLRGQRTEQQQRRLAVHGQFAAMPSGPRRQRLQALAGSLAGHPSGIWHRGLHDQGVPARPPPIVDLRQRRAE